MEGQRTGTGAPDGTGANFLFAECYARLHGDAKWRALEPYISTRMMTRTVDRTARRTRCFTESVIREMTRVAQEHDAVNLAQGFPDFPAPDVLKEAACAAIRGDVNQEIPI